MSISTNRDPNLEDLDLHLPTPNKHQTRHHKSSMDDPDKRPKRHYKSSMDDPDKRPKRHYKSSMDDPDKRPNERVTLISHRTVCDLLPLNPAAIPMPTPNPLLPLLAAAMQICSVNLHPNPNAKESQGQRERILRITHTLPG